ncbi:prepilin peptidase [Alicyclobacillus herbarius]|uniref:prepilin peptidase n=1 Tax=Alicyclobacillus herbarius TaxID=122960 RepID=UPI00138AC947|nr:A24 family peptidase [Alicyclobacillus herbarius]
MLTLVVFFIAELTWWSLRTDPWSDGVTWFCFWLLLFSAVICDLWSMRIPNVLTLPGAAVLFILRVTTDEGISTTLLGALVCAGAMCVLAMLTGGIGWGDVKLALSVGVMLGPKQGALALWIAFATASVVGVILRLLGAIGPRQPFPFAPFMLAGCGFCCLFASDLLEWLAVVTV